MDVIILGSTGHIGKKTFEVINHLNSIKNQTEIYNIVGISAKNNILDLENQLFFLKNNKKIKNLKYIYVKNEKDLKKLKEEHKNIEFFFGDNGLEQLIKNANFDILLNALSGFCGLKPTFEAICKGKFVAIANKESIICAGDILFNEASKTGAFIYPVDSEHSAFFEIMNNKNSNFLKKFILTASGGPFRNFTNEQLKSVSAEQAIYHPVWPMGKKISVESAAMINKGFELIEACFLFKFNTSQVGVLIHPQGLVHAIAEFNDGASVMYFSAPDMKIPIQCALTHLSGARGNFPELTSKNNLTKINNLIFEEPNIEIRNKLDIFLNAFNIGNMATSALCIANEIIIENFLNEQIFFNDMTKILEEVILNFNYEKTDSIDEILELSEKIIEITKEIINKKYRKF